jgi:3-oxoacyl-[acyl-carrier-protein] synthase-1
MRNSFSGIGMVTSLGWDTAIACAAARAGISRATELSLLNLSQYDFFGKENLEGFPVLKGHSCPILGEGFTGIGKIVELGSMALNTLPKLMETYARYGLLISLNDFDLLDRLEMESPELFYELNLSGSDKWFLQGESLVQKVASTATLNFNWNFKQAYYGGHAIVGQMLFDAVKKIRNGELDCVVVGAADSSVDMQMVVAAACLGLLFSEANPVGFSPGEAAGFLYLRRNDKDEIILGNKLRLEYVNHKVCTNNLFDNPISTGSDLVDLIMEAIESSNLYGSEEIKQVIIDANGLEWHAYEWGSAQVRLKEKGIDLSSAKEWLPAISFGEVGAATGVVALAMAEQGYLRGYFQSKTLVLLSSWSGNRSVLVVSGRGAYE